MINLKEKRKPNIEEAIYEAQVEEALAKWEAANPSEAVRTRKEPLPPKKGLII